MVDTWKYVRVNESDYNTLTLIARKENFVSENGKLSLKDAVHFLVLNFQDKIA